MSKILVLAPSGFGKTTSIGPTEEYGIRGLDPNSTYIISKTSKPLPFRGSVRLFPVTALNNMRGGRRVIIKSAEEVLLALHTIKNSAAIKNVVLDDFNYIMQDWYMANALSKGWDAPKQIGFFMGKIFDAFEELDYVGKNIIVLAHGEEVKQQDGRLYTKMKTTGKMVDEYITPEGKFDATLIGISSYDSMTKKVKKEFLTNENEFYSSAKSPIGMFSELLVPNDLGRIVESATNYYTYENSITNSEQSN